MGKRVAEYNPPVKCSVVIHVVEFSAHRSLQVQYTKPIVWVWHFYREFVKCNVLEQQCSRTAIRENLDPQNISTIRYSVLLISMYHIAGFFRGRKLSQIASKLDFRGENFHGLPLPSSPHPLTLIGM